MYYGNFEKSTNKSLKEFNQVKYAFKTKLCGPKQHPRFVIVQRLAVQLEVIFNLMLLQIHALFIFVEVILC